MTTGRTTSAVLTALALASGGVFTLAGGASAAPGGDLLYGLTSTDRLVTFRAETPNRIDDDRAITGVPSGTDLVGLDVRPATGELYALGRSTTTGAGQLFVIDESTGAATARGAAITPTLDGTRFGFDFNPAVDRVRIVSDNEQNLRVNPDTGGASARTPANGTVATDGPLQYAAGDAGAGVNPNVVAAGYTGNVNGTTATSLVDIDLARGTLVRQNPANDGTLSTIGSLGVIGVTDAGLDVAAGGTAYATLEIGSASGLYVVDLQTGAASPRGTFGAGTTASPTITVDDVTVASARFTASAATAVEGGNITVTVTRTGDVADAASVTYAVGGGTATEGADYAATTGTLNFGATERSRIFTIATQQDDFTEGRETVVVTLSGATVGNAGRPTTLSISDDEAGLAYGLTTANAITRFSVNSPGTVTSSSTVTGLPTGEDLVGIDVRPSTGVLYAVGRNAGSPGVAGVGAVEASSSLYRLETPTGNGPIAATRVGAITPLLSGNQFGVDFNPAADRLRVVSDTGQNLRLNVDNPGATTTPDGNLNYASTDANATVVPAVSGAGYTNSVSATPTATTLYDLETNRDVLVTQAPPNAGTLNTVGTGLGIGNVNPSTGLDIAASGNAAFALLSTTGTPATTTAAAVADTPNRFYRIDLVTGKATALTDGTSANPDPATTLEDFALVSTAASTTAPTASPTPTATPTGTPSATPTSTTSPTQRPTAPALPICATGLTITQDREFIIPTIPVRVRVSGATPGALVDLQAYSRPSDQYRSVRTSAAGSDGTITFDVTPGTNTRLFAQCVSEAGGPGQARSQSASTVINVRTALSLTVVRNGTRNYTFQGRILPRRADQLITLYRVERNGTRVITSQLKTDATGTYRLTRQFTGSGTFGFLTRTGQTLTNAAGESTSAERQRSEEYLETGRGTARPTAIF